MSQFDYSKFKIAPYADEIYDMIMKNPVCAIDAQTGSGKTLFIPYMLIKKTHERLRVRVALPITVSVTSSHAFQRKNNNFRVGYAAGRAIKYRKTDQIVYATTGHFTRKILSFIERGQTNFDFLGDILIIDEVHTSTVEISLLIGLLKYLDLKIKIVFASATFNHSDILSFYPKFPIYRVELDRLPIEHIYLKSHVDPLKSDPAPFIVDIISNEIKLLTPDNVFHGIVYQPGSQEVEKLIQTLEREFSDQPVVFLAAYSNLCKEEIDEIFDEYDGKMKVIVGTNIIESSLTIKDVGFIIDDGLVKRAETSQSGGQKLNSHYVSQAEATQRAGRTARTRSGKAYHLYTSEFYNTLDQYHEPEINRVPIYDTILQLINAKLDVITIIKISETRYTEALETLKRMDMVTINPDTDKLSVTETGKFISNLNLGIYNAHMIYLAVEKFSARQINLLTLKTTIYLAIMLECYGPPYFFVPRRKKDETTAEYNTRKQEHIESYHQRFRGPTDMHTLINIAWTMFEEIDISIRRSRRKFPYFRWLKFWASDNSMNNKKLYEFVSAVETVEEALFEDYKIKQIDREIFPTKSQMATITNKSINIFTQTYRFNTFELDESTAHAATSMYKHQHTGQYHKINKFTSFNSMEGTPQTIVAAQTIEIVKSGYTAHYIGLFVATKMRYKFQSQLNVLKDMGKCDESVAKTLLDETEGDLLKVINLLFPDHAEAGLI